MQFPELTSQMRTVLSRDPVRAALAVWAEGNGRDRIRVAQRKDLLCKSRPCGPCCFRWPRLCRPAGFEELSVFLLAVRTGPVDLREKLQTGRERALVEEQGNESALRAQRIAKPEGAGLERRPFRAERIRRHAQHKHAGMLQALLDFLRTESFCGPRLDLPFSEPDPQTVRPQTLRDRADKLLVLLAVAQEYIVCKSVSHTSPWAPRYERKEFRACRDLRHSAR